MSARDQDSESTRRARRFNAADELSWGGPGPTPTLPDRWTDVTDVVLEQLAKVRSQENTD